MTKSINRVRTEADAPSSKDPPEIVLRRFLEEHHAVEDVVNELNFLKLSRKLDDAAKVSTVLKALYTPENGAKGFVKQIEDHKALLSEVKKIHPFFVESDSGLISFCAS